MLRGNWHGEPLGSGTDTWKYWAEFRAGNINDEELAEVEEGIARSPGHCMVMGTASTMTSAAEVAGLDAAGRGFDPGRRFAITRAWRATAAAASSRWCGRI